MQKLSIGDKVYKHVYNYTDIILSGKIVDYQPFTEFYMVEWDDKTIVPCFITNFIPAKELFLDKNQCIDNALVSLKEAEKYLLSKESTWSKHSEAKTKEDAQKQRDLLNSARILGERS